MRHDSSHDDHPDTILKPLSPLAAAVEAASLEDLALFAIAVNRRARACDTPLSDSPAHDSAPLPPGIVTP